MVATGIAVVLAALAAGVLGLAVRERRLRQAAQVEARALRSASAGRDRGFGLLAREMQSLGMTLLGHAGGDQSTASAAAAVAGHAKRLLELSDGLTDLLAAGQQPRTLHAEPLPLLPVLEQAVAATSAQLGPARRDWRLAPNCAGITLRADPRALRGALEHVLARAARMTRDGDWIGIRPIVTPDALTIVVEDEGAGLAAEDIGPEAPVLADPAERTRGLGFGLAVARALIEAHGGSLRLEATQGVGARAWLTLPRERLLAPA
jgi:signal transduction histidine kinase